MSEGISPGEEWGTWVLARRVGGGGGVREMKVLLNLDRIP